MVMIVPSELWSSAALALAMPVAPAPDSTQNQIDPQSEADTAEAIEQEIPVDELEFRDSEGNLLPPEVQAQLRAQFQNNPPKNAGSSDDGITIRAERPRGAIVTDIVPEQSFNQLDLRALGASSVDELIDVLGRGLISARAGADEPPTLLLNGRRLADPFEIARIPPEAIERLDVFPERLAAQYGLPTSAKVLNIVTYANFASASAQAVARIPTEGGTVPAIGNVDYFRIDDDLRLYLGLDYSKIGLLTEAERDISQPMGREGEERFRSLIPRTEQFGLSGSITHPLSVSTSGTISARFQDINTTGLLGGTQGSEIVRVSDNSVVDLATSLYGGKGEFRWSSIVRYEDRSEHVRISRNPSDFSLGQTSLKEDRLLGEAQFAGPVVKLPAGVASVSLSVNAAFSGFDASGLSFEGPTSSRLSRELGGLLASLEVPISDEASKVGRLSSSYQIGYTALSDVDDLWEYGAGLDWSPARSVRFAVSFLSQETAPTLRQRGGPVIVTPNVRTLDFVTGQTVDVDFISGGNIDLQTQKLENLEASISFKPFDSKNFNLSAAYVFTDIKNPISDFPILTALSIQAFPDRFTRSASGELDSIDVRPSNFSRSEQERLVWGLSFSRPLGSVPEGVNPGGRVFRDKAEAERAFPGATVIVAEAGTPLARQGPDLSSRLFVNLYHTWFLEDRILLAPGSEPLDLLGGDAVDFVGGRRRHTIELNAGVFKRGLGAQIDAQWSSATSLVGALDEDGQALRFASFGTFDLRFFADLSDRFGKRKGLMWLNGSRISLAFENVGNTRPRAATQQGVTPIRYQGPYLEPIGRTVSLSFRKTF